VEPRHPTTRSIRKEPPVTVAELAELLADMDPTAEVRLAHQPRWALEYSVAAATQVDTDAGPVAYLAEGSQLGYLPGEAATAIGW
jgi:hypothetical protein